jgi:hypothetical protein
MAKSGYRGRLEDERTLKAPIAIQGVADPVLGGSGSEYLALMM